MGVASGCGEQEVGVASGSGWNLWVWLLGVVVRRYIDFLILLIPTPLVSVHFYSSIPTFCSFLNVFRSCSSTFVITFYVLNIFLTQYKHTYGQLRASHGSHMKAAHTVLYMKKHTQTYASYPALLYERGVDLEVEGVRCIEMHCELAANVLGPPSSRGRDLELEGGVNACHVEYLYESRDSHVRDTE